MNNQQPSHLPEKHFDKEKFEALEVLRKGAWEKFSSRRPHEWKACLALWTLLAALIAFLLKENPSLNCSGSIVITVGAIFIFGIHIFWLIGLAQAATINQNMEHELRDKMLEEINFKWSEEFAESIEKWRQRGKAKWYQANFYLYNWSQITQGGITMLLTALVICLAWSS